MCARKGMDQFDTEAGQYAVLKVQAGANHQNHVRVPTVMEHSHLSNSIESQLWHADMRKRHSDSRRCALRARMCSDQHRITHNACKC